MMTTAERIKAYKKFLDAVLSAGPDIQDDLNDLTVIRDAVNRIASRSVKRFGFSGTQDIITEEQWAEITSAPDVQAMEHQLTQRAVHRPPMASNIPNNTTAVLSASDVMAGKSVRQDMPSSPAGAGSPADWIAFFRQAFEFLVQHPELLTLIINLFKPQPATT